MTRKAAAKPTKSGNEQTAMFYAVDACGRAHSMPERIRNVIAGILEFNTAQWRINYSNSHHLPNELASANTG